MPSNVVVVHINQASDGTDAVPSGSRVMHRDDDYFLDKIAERWMHDTGQFQSGFAYRLDRLPRGYRGYIHYRSENGADSKQVDRFLYGHPNGYFRSMNDLYPHFKHLQDYGDARGCTCRLCLKHATSSARHNPSALSSKPTAPPHHATSAKGSVKPHSQGHLLEDRLSVTPPDAAPRKKKQVDEEGTPDVYRTLIDKLKAAGADGVVSEQFADLLSPDWRVGHDVLQGLLSEWQSLPQFVPRLGEIVLFARSTKDDIFWNASSQAYQTKTRQPVVWEAGVVTQMPVRELLDADLFGPPSDLQHVTYSGFRIEPLSEVGNEYKPFATQHKYVPLHFIRPFSLWRECTQGSDKWHPTIRHALKVASSFCILGKYSFKGTWPEATLFVKSIYIGAELIMLGDVVKLAPLGGKTAITDVMIITSIRLRFVKLDRASDDDYDSGLPYTTVLHVAGKAFTLDPKRSFGGIAKTPIDQELNGLPYGFSAYGHWFHMLDPSHEKARLEVPFHRLISRCHTETTLRAWFATSEQTTMAGKQLDLSQGFEGWKQARSYSLEHDTRIRPDKTWFWADSRIEQLDLHDINGKFAGAKDETRTSKQMNAWRQALKVLDGKKGGAEQYYAARETQQKEQKQRESVAANTFGMMGASGKQGDTDTDAERAEANAMDVDDSDSDGNQLMSRAVVDLVSDNNGDNDDVDDNGDGVAREDVPMTGIVVDLVSDNSSSSSGD